MLSLPPDAPEPLSGVWSDQRALVALQVRPEEAEAHQPNHETEGAMSDPTTPA
jgi:hypothetical protein